MQEHRTAFTALEVAATEHIPGKLVAKSVVTWADGQLILLVLPASYEVDLARVKTALRAQVTRLAHEKEFADAFADCEVGAVPRLGTCMICRCMWTRT